MSSQLTFDVFIKNLSELTVGGTYKYASAGRSTSGYCKLVSIDSTTGSIRYCRNGETKVENIAGNNVEKLATALASRNAVEINALYGGSGNFRSALEALAANTRNVFVCQIDGKKHIFWDPDSSHKVGEVTIASPPSVYVPPTPIVTRTLFPASVASGGGFDRLDILAAIRTKPFVLLAGISGTGKSRMVRQLARGCCPVGSPLWDEQKPDNFEMIQVRPNWHDSTELLGYVSRISGKSEYQVTPFVRFLAKAWLNLEVPFFLCLDEMNLAPVEQYFAEYLSVIETRKRDTSTGEIRTDPLLALADKDVLEKLLNELYPGQAGSASSLVERFKKAKGIPIPPNLVVMGTVNMDETTFSFSRKVLDRAMSFELSEVDMKGGLDADTDTSQGSIPAAAATPEFVRPTEFYAANQAVCDKAISFLEAVNAVLEATPFKVAYRTRDEVLLYCVERLKGGATLPQALDEATSMKVLSRVEGDQNRKGLLETLGKTIREQLAALGDAAGDCQVCSKKIDEMLAQLGNGAYTSFWTR